jgi:hypothetical protein
LLWCSPRPRSARLGGVLRLSRRYVGDGQNGDRAAQGRVQGGVRHQLHG